MAQATWWGLHNGKILPVHEVSVLHFLHSSITPDISWSVLHAKAQLSYLWLTLVAGVIEFRSCINNVLKQRPSLSGCSLQAIKLFLG